MSVVIHLRTNDNEKRLSLESVEPAGHADYFTATLRVSSRGFGCEYPFYFDRYHADRFLIALEGMINGAIAEGVLKQEFELDHLTFKNDRLGHVSVSGEVNDGTGHRLTFVIDTDQTVLRPFIDDFGKATAR